MVIHKHILVFVPLAVLLAGCHSGSDDDTLNSSRDFRFQVTITNLTTGQPLSPAAVVVHTSGWKAFTLGESASVELETLAEAGDNRDFIAAADIDSNVLATVSGQGAIVPGATAQVTATASASSQSGLLLTWASMPVNTNDGFVTVNSIDISGLAVGQSETYLAVSYDAGTEANTESADTVPGPAASGLAEGFNADRDDVRDAVYIHPGVVTQDDGLTTSTLGSSQRWDNPMARVDIERLQ
ncbi:spondin domain-containing protein [Marinobacter salarius]|uniref:spondin domain-containing protein n=1 Tax=Marinobacter salarius TaxID=1420917 RepID=UPI0018F23E56|nr:spondin domain-containing protein [Marinobacter salarius]MBJ7275413.1 spondin domain-containing protein [Marinobacter salarius]